MEHDDPYVERMHNVTRLQQHDVPSGIIYGQFSICPIITLDG
jgi:hypothetical protein